MRSNSLGVQLKKTEKELKQHEQEIVDQQQLHELTVKELELAKAAHKISQEECQQLKGRVSCRRLRPGSRWGSHPFSPQTLGSRGWV